MSYDKSHPNYGLDADKFVKDVADEVIVIPDYLTAEHAKEIIENVENFPEAGPLTPEELQDAIDELHENGHYEGS
jgi:hypothetical protein